MTNANMQAGRQTGMQEARQAGREAGWQEGRHACMEASRMAGQTVFDGLYSFNRVYHLHTLFLYLLTS